jgi:hypothetical protein
LGEFDEQSRSARRGALHVGAQELGIRRQNSVVLGKGEFMFGEIEQLKQKLQKMLTSNDADWVNTAMVTLNAMYKQFELEQEGSKQLTPPDTRGAPQPRIFVVGFRLPVASKGTMCDYTVSTRLKEPPLLSDGNLSFCSRRKLRHICPRYLLNPPRMNADVLTAAAEVLVASRNLIACCRKLRTEGLEIISSLGVYRQELQSTRPKSCRREGHQQKNRSIAA